MVSNGASGATNADLATLARDLAAAAPPGSMPRRAYGCAAVALSTTRSIPAARKALTAWDGPAEIVTAALAALGELTREAA